MTHYEQLRKSFKYRALSLILVKIDDFSRWAEERLVILAMEADKKDDLSNPKSR